MIAIFGTGRSGTSIIAHAAATRMGIDFGTLRPATQANPYGTYECTRLAEINRSRRDGRITPDEWRIQISRYLDKRGPRAGVKQPELADYLPGVVDLLPPETLIVWAKRDLDSAIHSRLGFVRGGYDPSIEEGYRSRWRLLREHMPDVPHLEMDMNRRWGLDEIAVELYTGRPD